jgi:hypothetical protein
MNRAAAAETEGRLICLFGPPGSGVSTIARILHDASELKTAVLEPDFDDFVDQVALLRRTGAQVIFVDGFPKSEEGVQYLWDNRLVHAGEGAIVQVMTDPELILHRRTATMGGIEAWYEQLGSIEEFIRRYDMPYFTIHNDDLENAVGDLARRASVTR